MCDGYGCTPGKPSDQYYHDPGVPCVIVSCIRTFNVPHGGAVPITLGRMLKFNAQVGKSDGDDPLGQSAVRKRMILQAMQVDSVEASCSRLSEIIEAVGFS